MPANTPLRAYTYPCYTDPVDFPAQMQEFATDVDTDIDNLVDAVAVAELRPLTRVRRTTTQSIPNAVATAVSWTQETFDTDNFIAVTSTTITFPFTGLYLASFNHLWDIHDAGGRRAVFRRILPSALDMANNQSSPGGTDLNGVGMVALLPMTAGDTMQIQVFQDSTVALGLNTSNLSIVQVS